MTGSQYSCISPCNIPQHSLIISVGNSGLAWYSSSQDWLPGYLAVSILSVSSQSGTGDGTFQNHCKHHQINQTMVSSLLPIIFAYFLGGVVLLGHVVHVSHHVSTTTPDSTNPKKPRNKKCSLLPDNQKMLRFWKFSIYQIRYTQTEAPLPLGVLSWLPSYRILSSTSSVKHKMDMDGHRYEESWPQTEAWLDKALTK